MIGMARGWCPICGKLVGGGGNNVTCGDPWCGSLLFFHQELKPAKKKPRSTHEPLFGGHKNFGDQLALQRNEGTQTALLLRGSAVNYANKAQRPSGVVFGAWKQAHPADLARDLAAFQADGGTVYVLEEDLTKRGLAQGDLIDGIALVGQSGLAGLAAEYDHVSFW